MDWFTGSKQGEVKKLISMLADPAKRDRAAADLIKLDGEATIPLIAALQTENAGLLPAYQQVLARIPSAMQALIRALETDHPLIRGHVIDVIRMRGDKTAIPALLNAIKGEYFTVRSRAALILADLGGPEVIPALLQLLRDPEDQVRMAACDALRQFNDPSTFDSLTDLLLDDPKIEVRQHAIHALGDGHHPAAIPFLMEALRDSFWWYEREQAAADLLNVIGNMGPGAVEPLIEALGEREGTVRKFAAIVLGRLGDTRAIEELGMTLYDLHHEVGQAAAEALAQFGSAAVDVLFGSMHHAEADIRLNAVYALGKIQDQRIVPALIEMLEDPDHHVRWQAITSLGQLRDARAIPALQQIASQRADRELSTLAKQVIATLQ
jgi:HEAT repeat protein